MMVTLRNGELKSIPVSQPIRRRSCNGWAPSVALGQIRLTIYCSTAVHTTIEYVASTELLPSSHYCSMDFLHLFQPVYTHDIR